MYFLFSPCMLHVVVLPLNILHQRPYYTLVFISLLHSLRSPHVLICTLFSKAAASHWTLTRADYKDNLDLYPHVHVHHCRCNIELSTRHFRYEQVNKTWRRVLWLAESLSVSQKSLLHGIGYRNGLNNLRYAGEQLEMTP